MVAVCSEKATEEVKLGLIAALKKENAALSQPHRRASEREADEYYPDLLGCVGALRDPRAAPLFAEALGTGGIAEACLMALGDVGADAAIQTLEHSGDVTARFGAAMTLGKMAAGANPGPNPFKVGAVSQKTRETIRSVLLRSAADDENIMVRGSSVGALVTFRDDSVRATVARLGRSDKGFLFPGTRIRRFPVRDAAREWVKQDSLHAQRP